MLVFLFQWGLFTTGAACLIVVFLSSMCRGLEPNGVCMLRTSSDPGTAPLLGDGGHITTPLSVTSSCQLIFTPAVLETAALIKGLFSLEQQPTVIHAVNLTES